VNHPASPLSASAEKHFDRRRIGHLALPATGKAVERATQAAQRMPTVLRYTSFPEREAPILNCCRWIACSAA